MPEERKYTKRRNVDGYFYPKKKSTEEDESL